MNKTGINTFGWALKEVQNGSKIIRSGWNGKNMWVQYHSGISPDNETQEMQLPYLEMVYPIGHPAYPAGCRVPWLASQTDILATDWSVME